jgi:hypothetical protein
LKINYLKKKWSLNPQTIRSKITPNIKILTPMKRMMKFAIMRQDKHSRTFLE